MNAPFRKNVDQAIASLIDPIRGFAYTCTRCGKHMKEEATAGHVCEGDQICVQGVEFTRDASMRYSCKICATMVPIVLVRAHAQRHPKPKPSYEEEEWSNVNMLDMGKNVGAVGTTNVSSSQQPQVEVKKNPVPQTQIEVKAVNVPQAQVEIRVQGEQVIPQGRMREGQRKRRGGEITYCLRKVRKVRICLERTMAVCMRGLFISRKKAFRKWLRLVSL